jgi:hypothetical protein
VSGPFDHALCNQLQNIIMGVPPSGYGMVTIGPGAVCLLSGRHIAKLTFSQLPNPRPMA